MKFLIVVAGLALAGCTAPLQPVSFDEPVAATSDLAAAVVLVSERLKLVREARDARAGEAADLGIQLIFAQTFHNPNNHIYLLDVVMGAKKLMRSLIPDVAAHIAENRKPAGRSL